MRKFKQKLNQLIADSPEGMDFVCSIDYKAIVQRMFHKHKGYDIVCSDKVPKGEIYFIKYELTKADE